MLRTANCRENPYVLWELFHQTKSSARPQTFYLIRYSYKKQKHVRLFSSTHIREYGKNTSLLEMFLKSTSLKVSSFHRCNDLFNFYNNRSLISSKWETCNRTGHNEHFFEPSAVVVLVSENEEPYGALLRILKAPFCSVWGIWGPKKPPLAAAEWDNFN